MNQSTLSPITEIIEDARNGKMFIIIDDEDRENEGDFIVSASLANVDQITTMINYSSGIICLVINEEKKNKLGLEFARKRGKAQNPLYTAFLDSIEASEGISTGVSSADRLQTIKAAIKPNANFDSIVTPGHVFPLLAHPLGLKARQGHTEASIAIMKLAGLDESAILCEIMNKDGTMSRLPELITLAKELNIKIGSIADLIKYIDENKKDFYKNISANTNQKENVLI
jgi:3,4-dihydroxy 2-butanone 4-phosphate synthase/GTP cyclohydrolase II